MIIKFLICIIFFIFGTNHCLENNLITYLELNQFVTNVLENNLTIASAKEKIKAADLKTLYVQVLDDPEFMVMVHDNPFSAQNEMKPRIRFEISQKLPLANKLFLRKRIAQKSLEVTQGEEITIKRQLTLQAKIAYFKLLFNYISSEINQKNQLIAQQIVNDTLALYRAGKGAQQDILKAQIELQLLKKEFLFLQSERVTICSLINVLLNKDPQAPVTSPKKKFYDIVKFSYEKLVSLAMQERSELQSMAAMVQEQSAIVKLAKAHYFPDAVVGFRYEYLTDKSQNTWGISLKINLPIWIDKKQRKEAEEAKARELARHYDLLATQVAIKGEIKELLAQLHATQEQKKLYRKSIIPHLKQILSASQASYRVGTGDFIFLLDTRRQWYNAQLEYYRLCIEQELLLVKLERAVGISLEQCCIRAGVK